MPPRRVSQRLHPNETPPQESIHHHPINHQPRTPHHRRWCGVPSIRRHPQRAPPPANQHLHHRSKVKPRCYHLKPSHCRAPCQSLPWAPSPIHTLPVDTEIDHIQINEWDEEAEEEAAATKEEELARDQQEIERLW
jgi:hypothetical protein